MEQLSKLTTEEFAELLDRAVSFPGAEPPDGSTYLGSGERNGTVFHLWKVIRNLEEGEQVLYASERGLKFAKEMQRKSSHKGSKSKQKIYNYNTT